MDNVMTNYRDATIVQMLREIEAEMNRLQTLIDEAQAHLDAYRQDQFQG
ncbi:MAG TPA: hypothetical protein VJ998_09965 [Pseudomonadales bacterium]|nr:hypothetical protein [Pseudomonadales bacterium]